VCVFVCVCLCVCVCVFVCVCECAWRSKGVYILVCWLKGKEGKIYSWSGRWCTCSHLFFTPVLHTCSHLFTLLGVEDDAPVHTCSSHLFFTPVQTCLHFLEGKMMLLFTPVLHTCSSHLLTPVYTSWSGRWCTCSHLFFTPVQTCLHFLEGKMMHLFTPAWGVDGCARVMWNFVTGRGFSTYCIGTSSASYLFLFLLALPIRLWCSTQGNC